ncbi:MAG: hypothetical protein QF473_40385 [Planctomycetota bacterium]|nr:hypothetical protein [Planctomycetota bacterium]
MRSRAKLTGLETCAAGNAEQAIDTRPAVQPVAQLSRVVRNRDNPTGLETCATRALEQAIDTLPVVRASRTPVTSMGTCTETVKIARGMLTPLQ